MLTAQIHVAGYPMATMGCPITLPISLETSQIHPFMILMTLTQLLILVIPAVNILNLTTCVQCSDCDRIRDEFLQVGGSFVCSSLYSLCA